MSKEHRYYVYIRTNKREGVLYVGVTNKLFKRSLQHNSVSYPNSFTAKYGLDKLVYYEVYGHIQEVIKREKQLKRWRREWKIKLINDFNPEWRDLFKDML